MFNPAILCVLSGSHYHAVSSLVPPVMDAWVVATPWTDNNAADNNAWRYNTGYTGDLGSMEDNGGCGDASDNKVMYNASATNDNVPGLTADGGQTDWRTGGRTLLMFLE